MVHKGEIIKAAIEKSGVKKTLLAAEMGISRGTLYNIFTQIDVDPATILKIGRIIHYDFSVSFSKLKSDPVTEEPQEPYKTVATAQLKADVDYWKEKYITLLEEYNKLLKK